MSNQYFTDAQLKELRNRKMVSIHPNTNRKGISNISQGEHFLKAARGDLVYVCVSNYRIEYIGIFTDDMPLYSLISEHEGWVERSIEILIEANKPSSYDTELDKWWAPRNNSTCIPVPESEIGLFESKILIRAFSISISELKNLQEQYLNSFTLDSIREFTGQLFSMSTDQSKLYSTLNSIDELTLRKLDYRYEKKSDGPVNTLRKKVIEMLLNGPKNINQNTIIDLKNTIGVNYQTNAFKSWKNDYNLLFPLIYDPHRQETKDTLNRFIKNIVKTLNIQSLVNTTLFDFYGPRNQGATESWIALYNKRHKSQKSAKQLFIRFFDNAQFEYGLYNELLKDRSKLVQTSRIDLDDIYNTLRQYIPEIKTDREDTMQELIGECIELLENSGNLVLTGAPGTGKTYLTKQIARVLASNNDCSEFIQFHPSYDYSDFMEGIKPQGFSNGSMELGLTDGLFMSFCKKALAHENQKYVFIIDEINRCDVSRVFGEVFSSLEMDYRGFNIKTQYSYLRPKDDREFTIPKNVYIVGTMNDIDRSVESMDFALRRRFVWKEISAKDSEIIIDCADLDQEIIEEAKKRMEKMNEEISVQMGNPAYQIGGAYFKNLEKYQEEQNCFDVLWEKHLKGVISEYVRGMPQGQVILNEIKNKYNLVAQ